MSVLVATAYMEEAERFDILVAMDDGKVLATGTPAELRERTATQSLEAAFVALLPERKRAGHHELVIRRASGARVRRRSPSRPRGLPAASAISSLWIM